jgi:hypothetical protein
MAEDEVGTESGAGTDDKAPWIPSVLRQPLSKLRAIVGITAGLISAGGVLSSLVGFVMIPTHGDFVAVVHEARSRQPILDATVEIATVQNAVVTTLVSMDAGRVRQKLKEGQYRVRVNHPKFTPEVRQVQVIAGQTSEVLLVLAPRPRPARPTPTKSVEKPGALRRFFRHLAL